MEQVQGQEVNRVEVFENDIEFYLAKFCEENNIENLKTESQSVWNSALIYVNRHAFNSPNTFKDKSPIEGYYNNSYNDIRSNMNKSNCNRYDIELLSSVVDIYIYICMLYDKIVTDAGFCLLTGIHRDTLHRWRQEGLKFSSSSSDVSQKLQDFREESLVNRLTSGKVNPIGIIATLKHYHGWEQQNTSDANKDRKTLTSEDVRALLSERGGQIEQKDNM